MSDSTHDREIVTTRVFDAPRALVFKMWTDPVHVAKWWGPHGFRSTIYEMDVRTGGVWRFTMHGPDGTNYPNKIVYREIVRPERLVYDHLGPDFRMTVTFAAEGGKTKITARMVFETAGFRDKVAKEFGAVEGLGQTLDRLGERVATVAAGGWPDEQLTLTRLFDAPRAVVFAMWTDPAHLRQWWGPRGFTNPVCEVDARPGGAIRIVMRAPDGAEHPMKGVFHEIVPPERLVFSNIAVDQEGRTLLDGLTIVSFAEEDGKTRLTLQTNVVGLVAQAARMLEGMEAGWTQSLERLADLLARQSGSG